MVKNWSYHLTSRHFQCHQCLDLCLKKLPPFEMKYLSPSLLPDVTRHHFPNCTCTKSTLWECALSSLLAFSLMSDELIQLCNLVRLVGLNEGISSSMGLSLFISASTIFLAEKIYY